jgi:FtsZ-binding cell division protein ZapB
MTVCVSCMRYENLLEKQRKEIDSLKNKLKQSPLQAISSLRAEVQELKETTNKTYQRVCNPQLSVSEMSGGQKQLVIYKGMKP